MGNICIGGPRMSQQVYSPERTDTPPRNDLREQTEADIEQNSESMRLQQKIDDLKPYVSHATGPMKAYGQAAMDRASGKKTDVSFAQLDAEHLDAMVDVENQHNPDLNLRYFKHHKEFIQALESDGPSSFRAIYPLTKPGGTGQAGKHHVMADVRLTPCEHPSIVITEPSVIVGKRNKQLHQHNNILEDLSESGVQLSQVAIIETQAQKRWTTALCTA